jgi:heme A synthase
MPRESAARKRFQVFLRLITSGHRYFAIMAVVILIVHFIVQYQTYGIRISGVIAGTLLILQGLLGAYGQYIRKRKQTAWFYAHRTVAVLLVAAMIIHILKF